jgi:hypothetical protein
LGLALVKQKLTLRCLFERPQTSGPIEDTWGYVMKCSLFKQRLSLTRSGFEKPSSMQFPVIDPTYPNAFTLVIRFTPIGVNQIEVLGLFVFLLQLLNDNEF